MGLFSFLASSFMEGWRNGQQGQRDNQLASHSLLDIPYTCHLTYPALLPSFEELAANGHNDTRAVLYTMLHVDVHRKKPFSSEGLNAQDFGNGKSGGRNACKILLDKGLIRRLDRERTFTELYTVPELKVLLRKLELPVSGNKPVLVKRLVLAQPAVLAKRVPAPMRGSPLSASATSPISARERVADGAGL